MDHMDHMDLAQLAIRRLIVAEAYHEHQLNEILPAHRAPAGSRSADARDRPPPRSAGGWPVARGPCGPCGPCRDTSRLPPPTGPRRPSSDGRPVSLLDSRPSCAGPKVPQAAVGVMAEHASRAGLGTRGHRTPAGGRGPVAAPRDG